jgi:hypothetical protein
VKMSKRSAECHRPNDHAATDMMFNALVRLEEKLLALQTLDDFDREILAIITPALNAVRGIPKSHSTDLEVQS